MKNKILYILLALSLGSCVVPRNYSRAKEKVDRIVNKFPEILENDTTVVLFDTTITTKGAQIDTALQVKKNDTVYIEKEKLRIRIIRGKRDTLLITAECEPDTIRIISRELVPVYSIEEHNLIKKKFLGLSYWSWALIAAVIITILILILLIKRKRSRPSENG